MIIEEISLRNWRGFRSPHTFRFKEGINLLVGRNEAGKSTLFEALIRVLIDRHNSRAEEIRAMQPIGSSLGPEASIQFRANGARYRSVKRFLQDPMSKLYSERGGKWELDHEGDEADARLRELLRAEATSRTAARPEHRGLAQALWYLQSDGDIPEQAWSEGVMEGLQGLVQLAARSPVEKAVLDKITASYREYWTPKGRVASNTELGRLQAELPALEEQLEALREKAKAIESRRTDLEELQAHEADKRKELQRAQAEVEELSKQVKQAEELEREREAKDRAKQEAFERAQRLEEHLTQVKEKQEKVRERKAEVAELERSLADVDVEIKVEESARERHARRWKEELEPTLKKVESELKGLHALERLRGLERERKRLEEFLERVRGIEKELEARKKERAELVAPDEREWRSFGEKLKRLAVLQAKVEASAVRVGFEWIGGTRRVQTRPRLQPSEDNEYVVIEPTEFEIEGVGKVRVRSGAPDLKDLRSKLDKVEQEIGEFLSRFGVSDADGAARLYEKGRDLDKAITALEERLKEAEEREPKAKEKLTQVMRSIQEEKRAASSAPPEALEQGEQWPRIIIAEKEQEKDRLIREIEEEQKAEDRATKKHLELLRSRQGTSTRLAECRAEINTHEEGIAAILENYGSIQQLEKLLAQSKKEAKKAKEALEAFLTGYEEKVVMPKRLFEQAQNRVRELDKRLNSLQTDIAATLARIEEYAAQGNYGQLADMEIEVDRKRRRLRVLKRRAEGAKLLYDIVRCYEEQRSAALSGPIQGLLNRWLGILTEDRYNFVMMDSDLKPTAVHVEAYDADLPLVSLSYGAREQVVVLLRLAIAVLVSSAERNLVVIDDRLVNADPIRMKRLCLILEEVAKSCQIVIAACNDTPYAGLGAHIVRVPTDGSKETIL